MDPDLAELDAFLDDRGLDGYLIDATGADPDQRYLTAFGAPDPFVSLYADGQIHLLVRGLERALAREDSRAASVTIPADIAGNDPSIGRTPTGRNPAVIAAFLDRHAVASVAVPPRFPVREADGLRDAGITLEPDEAGVIESIRAVKTDGEIEQIRQVQRATEAAMRRAEGMFADATVDDGILRLAGEPLTSERVKTEVRIELLRTGCLLEDIIVAGGADAAEPHNRGGGPLPADAPIVLDIFPRDDDSHYHGDMTRTFCVGEPSDRAATWYELTVDAQDAALEAIEPGTSTEAVHDAACAVYEAAGLSTNRTDPTSETGYIHGTGHGVGLALHERPRVSLEGEPLQPGQVFSIEPGLYDPSVGGIRIEDLVVVTEDGYTNLNQYERTFVR